MLLNILIFIIIYETIITLRRKYTRRRLYWKALNRSFETGKKLLVVGDPYNGIASIVTGTDYDCGDYCIDLTGCPKCKNGQIMKLEEAVEMMNLDNYIVFISCVLEYVDDIEKIVNVLNKLDNKNLFIVTVEYYSIMAYFYPYFLTKESSPKQIIYNTNPIKYFKNPF
jgi:hypothetical protein